MNLFDLTMMKPSIDDITCKGLFYRYNESSYKKRDGYAKTIKITKLKRMSCKGCSDCGSVEDCINAELEEFGEFPLILPDDIRNGDVITPRIEITSIDFETGYPDSCEIYGDIVKDENGNKRNS